MGGQCGAKKSVKTRRPTKETESSKELGLRWKKKGTEIWKRRKD